MEMFARGNFDVEGGSGGEDIVTFAEELNLCEEFEISLLPYEGYYGIRNFFCFQI